LQVIHAILTRTGDRGVLVITHSDIALEEYDEVLELRDGRIEPLCAGVIGVSSPEEGIM
jgi:ABC-type transport system involved in cytochrome bd biosynthesis fused ATPase/permease subunit